MSAGSEKRGLGSPDIELAPSTRPHTSKAQRRDETRYYTRDRTPNKYEILGCDSMRGKVGSEIIRDREGRA